MWTMIPSLAPIVEALAPTFTQPSAVTCSQLLLAWVMCLGRHTLRRTAENAHPDRAPDHSRRHGLDMESFEVVADFPIDGVPAGEDLAKKFKALPDSRWELTLAKPIKELRRGKLTVAVKDRQGNVSRIERTFSVTPEK